MLAISSTDRGMVDQTLEGMQRWSFRPTKKEAWGARIVLLVPCPERWEPSRQ